MLAGSPRAAKTEIRIAFGIQFVLLIESSINECPELLQTGPRKAPTSMQDSNLLYCLVSKKALEPKDRQRIHNHNGQRLEGTPLDHASIVLRFSDLRTKTPLTPEGCAEWLYIQLISFFVRWLPANPAPVP